MSKKSRSIPQTHASSQSSTNGDESFKARWQAVADGCDLVPPDNVWVMACGISRGRPGQVRRELEELGYQFEAVTLEGYGMQAVGGYYWKVVTRPKPEAKPEWTDKDAEEFRAFKEMFRERFSQFI